MRYPQIQRFIILFVSGFPLFLLFFPDVRNTMVYLISGQSQVKSMLLTYCAPHCVGSGFCVGSACLTVVTLSQTKSTNYIYIYHHISHIYIYITLYIYLCIYTTKSSNRPNRHRIWCLCCSCCCSMCCRCRSSSICCCICCFAISGSGLCICNWMVATFPEAVRDRGDFTKTATIVLLGPAIYSMKLYYIYIYTYVKLCLTYNYNSYLFFNCHIWWLESSQLELQQYDDWS